MNKEISPKARTIPISKYSCYQEMDNVTEDDKKLFESLPMFSLVEMHLLDLARTIKREGKTRWIRKGRIFKLMPRQENRDIKEQLIPILQELSDKLIKSRKITDKYFTKKEKEK